MHYKKIRYIYIKLNNTTYYQRNREMILNRAKNYYENDKERLREQARDKYRNLSEEYKNKKREYGKNRYHNMPKEKKQKIKEHQKKNIEKQKKSKHNNYLIAHVLYLDKLTEIKA